MLTPQNTAFLYFTYISFNIPFTVIREWTSETHTKSKMLVTKEHIWHDSIKTHIQSKRLHKNTKYISGVRDAVQRKRGEENGEWLLGNSHTVLFYLFIYWKWGIEFRTLCLPGRCFFKELQSTIKVTDFYIMSENYGTWYLNMCLQNNVNWGQLTKSHHWLSHQHKQNHFVYKPHASSSQVNNEWGNFITVNIF